MDKFLYFWTDKKKTENINGEIAPAILLFLEEKLNQYLCTPKKGTKYYKLERKYKLTLAHYIIVENEIEKSALKSITALVWKSI